MISVQILEDDDLVEPYDWCRPLQLSDGLSDKNQYSGCPENNVKWVKVSSVIGSVWFGKSMKELNDGLRQSFEVCRGTPPGDHCLNMQGFTVLSDIGNNMTKLVDGKIPAFTDCPFRDKCPSNTNGTCGHTGPNHPVPYSCGYARLFKIFES